MTPSELEVIKIIPRVEDLIIQHTKDHGDYKCPEENCSFTTTKPSLLGLHKAQAHGKVLYPKARKGFEHQYFCPGPGCYYNTQTGRFFKTFELLRTHYTTVHGEKKFKCKLCSKAFALERDCLRHEKECGMTFSCLDCGKTFNAYKSLYKHCVSNLHTKPDSLKPKVTKTKSLKSAIGVKSSPIPILPKQVLKFAVPVSVCSQVVSGQLLNFGNVNNNAANSNTYSLHHNYALPVKSQTKTIAHGAAQTVRSCIPLSTLNKRHTPAQTNLSILEQAMKTSKVPVVKASKTTETSPPENYFKKKTRFKNLDQGNRRQRNNAKEKMTVSTLTEKSVFHNIGLQTTFPITLHNQFNVVSSSNEEDKSSSSAQTTIFIPQNQSNQCRIVIPSTSSYNQKQKSELRSIVETQTMTEFDMTLINSHTQTPFNMQLMSTPQLSTTNASEIAIQTGDWDKELNDNFDVLNPLFACNQAIDANTQTFGCFSSDMMTQTLNGITSDPNINNTLQTYNISSSNNMTTQTIGEMLDSISQTFDLECSDSTTQTNLITNDTMTQTCDNGTVDISIQTYNPELSSVSNRNNIETLLTNYSIPNLTNNLETDLITQHKSQSSQSSIFDETEVSAINIDSSQSLEPLSNNLNNEYCFSQTSKFGEQPTCSQSNTKTGLFYSSAVYQCVQTDISMLNESEFDLLGPSSLTDSMTQTQPNSQIDVVLDALLSDMATQTFDNNDFEFDALLESTDDFHSTILSQSTNIVSDTACQTSTFELHDTTDTSSQKSLNTTINSERSEYFCESMETQTDMQDVRDISLQTDGDTILDFEYLSENLSNNPITGVPMQHKNVSVPNDKEASMSTQTGMGESNDWNVGGCDLESMGTQTITDNLSIWDMGTQTGINNESLWEIGTQTVSVNNSIWNMGTQTGIDNDHLWEIGTQTGTNQNIWDMETQTGEDNDNIWEIGTQTGSINDNIWDIGTQTGLDNDNLWETGTQTISGSGISTHTTTQTGDDLIKYLLAGEANNSETAWNLNK